MNLVMKKKLTNLSLDDLVKEAEEPRETVRVTVSLDKNVFESFKKRCGEAPVSRVVNKILQEIVKDEEAA